MMEDFNSQYFAISRADAKGIPYLSADEDTEDRDFETEPQVPGSPPLVFTNGIAEHDKKIEDYLTPDIMFCGYDIVVNERIRAQIFRRELPNVYLHPSVYIDNKGVWHENYWFLGVLSRLDCWDRDSSQYNRAQDPIRIGSSTQYFVDKYSLDTKKLSTIPLQERLLFRMSGTLANFVVCHESIRNLFSETAPKGARIVPVCDFT